jgi:hypothetical protein
LIGPEVLKNFSMTAPWRYFVSALERKSESENDASGMADGVSGAEGLIEGEMSVDTWKRQGPQSRTARNRDPPSPSTRGVWDEV